jgi:hypothetical protein
MFCLFTKQLKTNTTSKNFIADIYPSQKGKTMKAFTV